MEPSRESDISRRVLFLLRDPVNRDRIKQAIKEDGLEAVKRSIRDFLRELDSDEKEAG